MDAVGQALRDLVGECDDMWEQVDMFYTLRGVSCSSQQCERMRAVVERSLPAQQDDPLLGFFRSLSQR
jgi:hypothetical protein